MKNLKRIYEYEKIVLPALSGNRIVLNEKKLFNKFGIDPDFLNWGLNKKEKKTPETEIRFYELINDSTLIDIFNLQNLNVSCLTQDQIIEICENHYNRLRPDPSSTFILFKKKRFFKKNEYFVANIKVVSGLLEIHISRINRLGFWFAEYRHLVIIPVVK